MIIESRCLEFEEQFYMCLLNLCDFDDEIDEIETDYHVSLPGAYKDCTTRDFLVYK